MNTQFCTIHYFYSNFRWRYTSFFFLFSNFYQALLRCFLFFFFSWYENNAVITNQYIFIYKYKKRNWHYKINLSDTDRRWNRTWMKTVEETYTYLSITPLLTFLLNETLEFFRFVFFYGSNRTWVRVVRPKSCHHSHCQFRVVILISWNDVNKILFIYEETVFLF